MPGPLVRDLPGRGLVDGASTGERVVGGVEAAAPAFVEHLDGLDSLLVLDEDQLTEVDPTTVTATPVARPLDPLTPVHLVDELPAGRSVDDAGGADRWRRDGGVAGGRPAGRPGRGRVDMAVDYAKERHQFGKPIGSFQAIKHLLADAHTGVELARVAVQAAAVEIDEGASIEESARSAASARMVASTAAHLATTTSIQVHGGMGYTWELDAHLLLKRVMVLDQAPGTVEAALQERAAALR